MPVLSSSELHTRSKHLDCNRLLHSDEFLIEPTDNELRNEQLEDNSIMVDRCSQHLKDQHRQSDVFKQYLLSFDHLIKFLFGSYSSNSEKRRRRAMRDVLEF
jgi:hypothetical protein